MKKLWAWSSETVKRSAAALVWICLHIPADYRHLSGKPAENEQTRDTFKARRSNDEALTEISILVSASSIPQNLSFQVRGGGAVMAPVRCKHAMQYYYHRGDQGRCLPPVLWGEESNVSGHWCRVSARWTKKPSAKESILIPQTHGEKRQTVAMETLSSDWPIAPPLFSRNPRSPPPPVSKSRWAGSWQRWRLRGDDKFHFKVDGIRFPPFMLQLVRAGMEQLGLFF